MSSTLVNLEHRCNELGMSLKEGISICKRYGVQKKVIGKGANLKYMVVMEDFDSGLKGSMSSFKLPKNYSKKGGSSKKK